MIREEFFTKGDSNIARVEYAYSLCEIDGKIRKIGDVINEFITIDFKNGNTYEYISYTKNISEIYAKFKYCSDYDVYFNLNIKGKLQYKRVK